MTKLDTVRENLRKSLIQWKGKTGEYKLSTPGQMYLLFSVIRDDSLDDDNYTLAKISQSNMNTLLYGDYD